MIQLNCTVCGRSYRTKGQLRSHITRVHHGRCTYVEYESTTIVQNTDMHNLAKHSDYGILQYYILDIDTDTVSLVVFIFYSDLRDGTKSMFPSPARLHIPSSSLNKATQSSIQYLCRSNLTTDGCKIN